MRSLWLSIGLTGALCGAAALFPLRADGPPATAFAQAHEAYRAKDYARAYDLYKQVAATVSNPAVHYDLGCAAFKAGHVGEAVLQFEKAHRLTPRDADISSNLEFARGQIKDATPDEETDFLTRLVWGPLDRVSLNEVSTAVSLAWWLSMAALLALVLTRDPARRATLRVPLAGLLVLTAVLAVPFAMKYHAEEMNEQAIVLAREVPVLSGPGTDEVKRFVLHEGTRVRLLGRWDKWLHVALPSGENGWAIAETLGVI